jgi:hypothetical protein
MDSILRGELRKGINDLVMEYGPFAVAVYLTTFVCVLLGAWAAIQIGWQPQSASGNAGALAAAYVTTKVTQPLRIAATIVLTPLAARGYQRFFRPGG